MKKGILKPPSPDSKLKSFPSLPEDFLLRLGVQRRQRMMGDGVSGAAGGVLGGAGGDARKNG